MQNALTGRERDKFVESSDGDTAVRIIDLSNLLPGGWDDINITYVGSGDGVGEIETVTYLLSGVSQLVLTLAYDGSNKLVGVTKS